MSSRHLVALPIYNEVTCVDEVLDAVTRHATDILVVDDGSDDGTAAVLARRDDVLRLTHSQNRGYGAALQSAFQYAVQHGYEVLITVDCDGQHEPALIPDFVKAMDDPDIDIVSGSRYLRKFEGDSRPPEQRRWINRQITAALNERLGFELTDAFCGFKAYRVSQLPKLQLTEDGYAMPLELWVQAACQRLAVKELAIPLIYLDAERSFGGALDEPATRLNYYHRILERSFAALPSPCQERFVGEVAG